VVFKRELQVGQDDPFRWFHLLLGFGGGS
jgi:hypothetical protein